MYTHANIQYSNNATQMPFREDKKDDIATNHIIAAPRHATYLPSSQEES